MGFVDDYLTDDEELVLHLKPHWWVFSIPAIILGGLLLVLIISRNITVLPQAIAVASFGVAVWVGWVYL
ncbi:MAG: PH domain-containing protein, partial [Acidimicrobiales bacterium]